MASNEITEFQLTCRVQTRWVPYFLGMLKHMQRLGSRGSSREVTFYADGDGDFRPKFSWPDDLPAPVEPTETKPNGDTFFDAG